MKYELVEINATDEVKNEDNEIFVIFKEAYLKDAQGCHHKIVFDEYKTAIINEDYSLKSDFKTAEYKTYNQFGHFLL